MSKYLSSEIQEACDLLEMGFKRKFIDLNINGTPITVSREGDTVHLELSPYDAHLIITEEVDREIVIDALFEADKEVRQICAKIEEYEAKEKNESSKWTHWPSDFRAPPDDELCLVTFVDNGQGRTLVGKYHEEFSLWAFPTLDGRVQTFTENDKNISEVYWRPL